MKVISFNRLQRLLQLWNLSKPNKVWRNN